MNETAVLAFVFTALWGLVVGLAGVIWATLKERIRASEVTIDALEKQNREQEVAIGRLTERAIAREEAHSQHREDTQSQFSRIDATLNAINGKLDDMLKRGRTPYPTGYQLGPDTGRKT
jgi:hypothetical protein